MTVVAWVLQTKQTLPAETGKQQLCTILGHKVLKSHEVSAGSVFSCLVLLTVESLSQR